MSVTAIGSMPANGSSSRMNCGETTSARVISARRRSPPDSVCAGASRERRQVQLGEELRAAAPAASRHRAPCVSRIARMFCSHASGRGRSTAPAAGSRCLCARGRTSDRRSRRGRSSSTRPGVGRGQADRHVERRRLAGAVRAEQADDFTRRRRRGSRRGRPCRPPYDLVSFSVRRVARY